MNLKYKITIIITSLLLLLSISLSTLSYMTSLNNTEKQLKTQALPLSLNNIYSDVEKSIIEPHLVSSMMASDTFVQEWLKNGEKEDEKIIKYLKSIKNKYSMFSTFFVSEKSKNYYTNDGFVEKLSIKNKNNKWYYDFKNIQEIKEINLDYNEHISNTLILFINYKILDENFNYLGTTGVALKLLYVNDLLKKFRQEYNFTVMFFDQKGNVALAEDNSLRSKNINDITWLKPYKDLILSKKSKSFEYVKNEQKHLVNTKYLPELNLYLSVDANLEYFIQQTKRTLYINIFTSLIITILIMLVVYLTISKYSNKLERLSNYDTLTNIPNRRHFEIKFEKEILSHKKYNKDLALIFIDIDNFKLVNDTLGHNTGDEILRIISKIFKDGIRKNDLLARWGGEEFVISLTGSSLEDSFNVAENLRVSLENNAELKKLLNYNLTGSFGLTMFLKNDTQENAIKRADEAMYLSKQNGKNKITVL